MKPDYDAHLDDEIRAYVADCAAFSSHLGPDATIDQIRAAYDALAEAMRAPRPAGLQVSDGQVGRVPLRVYGHGTATVLYMHGGGFAMGGLESHDDVCAEIASGAGVRVVAVAYRLTPEHPHPAQLEDCDLALSWVRERFGPRVILAGDSAGGTLAACLAQRHRHRGLLGQVLIYPALSLPGQTGSYTEHAEAPMLTAANMQTYWSWLGEGAQDLTPLATPDVTGLPPALVLSAQYDPLRDDARLYAGALQAVGVTAQWHPGEGLVHSYLRARHRSARAAAAFQEVLAAIRRYSVN